MSSYPGSEDGNPGLWMDPLRGSCPPTEGKGATKWRRRLAWWWSGSGTTGNSAIRIRAWQGRRNPDRSVIDSSRAPSGAQMFIAMPRWFRCAPPPANLPCPLRGKRPNSSDPLSGKLSKLKSLRSTRAPHFQYGASAKNPVANRFNGFLPCSFETRHHPTTKLLKQFRSLHLTTNTSINRGANENPNSVRSFRWL